MIGDNDSTDLKVTNSQQQEQRVHNKCVEGRRRHRDDLGERAGAERNNKQRCPQNPRERSGNSHIITLISTVTQ